MSDSDRLRRIRWLASVRDDPDLSSRARLACFVLSTYMKSTDTTCFPSFPTIAGGMGVSENTARAAISEAEAASFLEVRARSECPDEREVVTKRGLRYTLPAGRPAGGKKQSNVYSAVLRGEAVRAQALKSLDGANPNPNPSNGTAKPFNSETQTLQLGPRNTSVVEGEAIRSCLEQH